MLQKLRSYGVLFKQDMRERFAGALLGRLWIFIWPLVQLFNCIVIFGKLMGGRFPGDAQVYSYGVSVVFGLKAASYQSKYNRSTL